MPLPNFSDETAWQDEIEAIHAQFRKATITIYDKTTPVISNRSARVQQQRTPTIATEAGQQIAKRAFLFEIELKAGDPIIKKNMVIRVTNGGRDPQLVNYVFTVTNSVNSSEAAIRTIETITELAVTPAVP